MRVCSFSDAVATTVTLPLDVLKTRYQVLHTNLSAFLLLMCFVFVSCLCSQHPILQLVDLFPLFISHNCLMINLKIYVQE